MSKVSEMYKKLKGLSPEEYNDLVRSTLKKPTDSTSNENKIASSNNYTLNDLIKANQPTDVKSPYEQRMDEYTDMYNKQVEANNQNARNQSAIAYAQMQEINKNANELNKASGRQNTGYAGDISIDSYNAYRNSVNEAQRQANASNNDLFNYYLQNMSALEQEKVAQEMAREQMDYEKTKDIMNNLDIGSDDYYENGNIKETKAKELWDYITTTYGGVGNIPKEVAATLNTTKGFNEWLEAYNSGNTESYQGNKGTEVDNTGTAYRIINADATVGSQIRAVRNNNFKIKYNDKEYLVETGNQADTETALKIRELILDKNGTVKEGDLMYYGGKLYVVAKDSRSVFEVSNREGVRGKKSGVNYDTLLNAIKSDMGM
jgi:hypothetical protein